MQNIFDTVLATTKYVLTGASILCGAIFAGPAWADHDARPVKIMIINMFGGPAPSEASAFTGNLHLTEDAVSLPPGRNGPWSPISKSIVRVRATGFHRPCHKRPLLCVSSRRARCGGVSLLLGFCSRRHER
jgi:hypothetical protein